MKKQAILLIIGFIAFTAGLVVASSAHAEDGDDLLIKVCAAVYPCDENGDVLPEFADGECADVYKEQCAGLTPESLGDKSRQCRVQKRQYRRLLDRKDRTIKHLQRSLRRLQIAKN